MGRSQGVKVRFTALAQFDAATLQLAAAKAQSRLKEYFNRAVLGPRLLVVNEVGFLPFGARRRTSSSTQWPSATSAFSSSLVSRRMGPQQYRKRSAAPSKWPPQVPSVVLLEHPGAEELMRPWGKRRRRSAG